MEPQTDWYERRHKLMPGMVVVDFSGTKLRLDHRVPGDGTNWSCDVWYTREDRPEGGFWCADEHTIHPGDIVSVEGT